MEKNLENKIEKDIKKENRQLKRINKFIKLRRKLKNAKITGTIQGELQASKSYYANLKRVEKEHEKQIREIIMAHRKEIKILEKDYNFKSQRLDKKIDKIHGLMEEWEQRVNLVKEIAGKSQELLARIKHSFYQDRKKFANMLDDEKSMEQVQTDLNKLLQKTVPPHQEDILSH